MEREMGFSLGWLVAAAALLSGVGCAGGAEGNHGSDQVSAEMSTARCYALELQEGEPRLRGIPEGIELRTDRLEGWPGRGEEGPRYEARSLVDGERRETPFNYWTPLAGDSILVAHPGAMQGFTLRLAGNGDRLEGRIIAFTDVTGPEGEARERSASIQAARMDCSPEES